MSDGVFNDWMMNNNNPVIINNYSRNYREERQIRELGTELSSLSSSLDQQRVESTRLRSQLATLQGSLEDRINQMGRAFDAFVELSDIRMVLAMFDAPALVRHRSRQLLTSLAEKTDSPIVPLLPADADVPDYWLAPAVRALIALLADADATADIAVAQRLDAAKTSLLIAATATLAGRRDVAGTWLPTALAEFGPDTEVSRMQRMLWREAARGSFGSAGEDLIEARLRTAMVETPTEALRTQVSQLTGSPNHLPLLDTVTDVQAAIVASQHMASLRAVCESTGIPAQGGADGPAALGGLVRGLVDEGTEEEKPLLERADELRAIIENRAVEAKADWDGPAGTLAALVLADAFHPEAGPAGAMARRVMADGIAAIADELATAATVMAPSEIATDVGMGRVRITATGPDAQDVAAIRTAIEKRYPPVVVIDPLTWGLAAGGVVLCVLAIFLPTALLVLGLIAGVGALGAAGIRWAKRRTLAAEKADLKSRALRETDRRIEEAGRNFVTSATALAAMGEQAAADRTAIRDALAGVGV